MALTSFRILKLEVIQIVELLDIICIVLYILYFVFAIVFCVLNEYEENKIRSVYIDGELFENVKVRKKCFCNVVVITFPETNREVFISYKTLEYLS